jgi:hypothetical protein
MLIAFITLFTIVNTLYFILTYNLNIILVNIYGYNWMYSKIHTKTLYAAGDHYEVDVDLELKIGLFGFNVTCLGTPRIQNLNHTPWTIDWNEHFRWAYPWHQGRAGFGQFSSPVSQHFRERENYGIPYPILWIAEYLTLDGELIRWGRHLRMAGYFTFLIQRTAFGGWIVCMVLFLMKALDAASITTFLTGTLILSGNIVYWLQSSSRPSSTAPWDYTINPFRLGANHDPLAIPWPIPDEDGVQFMRPQLSHSYFLTLVAGLLMVIIGVLTRPTNLAKSVFSKDDGDRMDLDDLVEAWEERNAFKKRTLFDSKEGVVGVRRLHGGAETMYTSSSKVAGNGGGGGGHGKGGLANTKSTIKRLATALEKKKKTGNGASMMVTATGGGGGDGMSKRMSNSSMATMVQENAHMTAQQSSMMSTTTTTTTMTTMMDQQQQQQQHGETHMMMHHQG